MIVVAIVGLTAVVVLSTLWAHILDDRRYWDDADFCYGCTNVWCDRVPEECGGSDYEA